METSRALLSSFAFLRRRRRRRRWRKGGRGGERPFFLQSREAVRARVAPVSQRPALHSPGGSASQGDGLVSGAAAAVAFMSRRRVSASPELSWRQDQALGTTMRIVRELGPTAFVLQEEDQRAAELRVEEGRGRRGRRRAKKWDPRSRLHSRGWHAGSCGCGCQIKYLSLARRTWLFSPPPPSFPAFSFTINFETKNILLNM